MLLTEPQILNAEMSADRAAAAVERHDPFVLVRYGDGDLYFMKADTADQLAGWLQAALGDRPGRPPLALAGGEQWSPALRDALRESFAHITGGEHTLLLGDPRSNMFGRELIPYWKDLTATITRSYTAVSVDMFWLTHRRQTGLHRLLRAITERSSAKVLIGREELRPAAGLIGARLITVNPYDAFADSERAARAASDSDLVLVCAGRGGKPIIANLLDSARTIIDAGALFDPLLIGNTRPRPGVTLTERHIERFFTDATGQTAKIAANRPGRLYGPG